MSNKLVSSAIFILIALLVNRSEQCTRYNYIGGPSNNIIKAMEFIDEQMQLRNVGTDVFYINSATGVNAIDGSAYTEFVYVIEDAGAAAYLLYMKISTYQNFTFVDEYVFIPAVDDGGAIEAQVTAVIGALDESVFTDNALTGINLTDQSLYQNCNLNKEAYSYFYELFGDRFRQDLNN